MEEETRRGMSILYYVLEVFYARKKFIFLIGDSQHARFVAHYDPQMVSKR
jgi:hypothetical protein